MVSLQIQIYNRSRESYHNHKHSQEFFSKYFISCIDTGPSILSNGSNSIILSCCLFFLYLFLVFSHKAAATQLQKTFVFRNILYRDTTAFIT